ncbi:MAG: hypothetical protein ACOX22_03385 [Caldicoprobacterales bacterium]|jgi:type IV pilus assembly protein PilO
MMKLTKREILLLKIAGLAALVAISYYFVIYPELDKLYAAQEQLMIKTQEVETVKKEIESIPELDEEINILKENIKNSYQEFYPNIQQKKIILILDELLENSGVKAGSLEFSQSIKAVNNDVDNSNSENTESDEISNIENDTTEASSYENYKLNAYSMSIQAPLLGRYEDIIAFIAGIEDLNRAIVINNLQISQDTNGIISGNIVLEFYSVYKPIKNPSDEEYLSWNYASPRGVYNPFPVVPVEDMSDVPENEESVSEN